MATMQCFQYKGFRRLKSVVFWSLNSSVTLSYSLFRTRPPHYSVCLSFHTSDRPGMRKNADLFEYTSGRWIFNDAQRHSERTRSFNVSEFKRLAAMSINQSQEDVLGFDKLAEGGFNRSFLITMRDGFQFVGRIPYLSTEPKYLSVASEVATMDFLRSNGFPIPKIYGHSATTENAAGTEYVFMELINGTNLGDIWHEMSEKARITVVTKLVEVESRLFALRFPASGSLYYAEDLQTTSYHGEALVTMPEVNNRLCIGPETTLGLWYGKRGNVHIARGPYSDPVAVLEAGAKKEMAYLKKFGRPLQPFHRLRREIYDYQKQSHLEHIESLKNYLRIAPYLVPDDVERLARPVIRHPDLQPNNVFISESLEITGLIDWQHCTIMPLFLQSGIPDCLQNYGDSVSESLETPRLCRNFDDLAEREQLEQVDILRRRQLHYSYMKATATFNQLHYEALTDDLNVLRRKLYAHASDPWEGDNITLKTDLIHLTNMWASMTRPASSRSSEKSVRCPLDYSAEERSKCLQLNSAQNEADEQLKVCRDIVGVGPEGWVPLGQYEAAKQREMKLKADALDAAESLEEKDIIQEHWIFDDFDENEYL